VTVSVVIPTLGRASLHRAVQSALTQTEPVGQVVIVADTDSPLNYPADDRITLVRNTSAAGPAFSRQRGIDTASGSVIALLDDDDEWHPDKLRRQLAVVAEAGAGPHWIASCRVAALGPGERRRLWPRRLIGQREPVAGYLFGFTDFRHGGRLLQTSTLCFPIELAKAVRWDAHGGAVHDEPSWILAVARLFTDLRVIQLPDVLCNYHVGHPSASRHTADLTDSYIGWGMRYLDGESARVRGDYLCSSPVSAAVAAGSLSGITRAVRAGIQHGRPGAPALGFAALSAMRVMLRRAGSSVRR
jgi:glycosyltransferase involved in cell wall biosynthesis